MQKLSSKQVELFRSRLGVVTDEIDQDLELALEVARELGLRNVDLNTLWGKNIVELTNAEVEHAADLLNTYDIKVGVLCSPCFKSLALDRLGQGSINRQEAFLEHLRDLERGMDIAPIFGTTLVRVFSCRRPNMAGLGNPSPRHPLGGEIKPEDRERIAEGLTVAAAKASDRGITLVLENVRSCYANSGHNAAVLLDRVGSDHLRCLWDPGNSFVSGQYPYPEGYLEVKPFIKHVHFKNATLLDHKTGLTQWEPIGEGEIDFEPQIHALIEDGLDTLAMLETHWSPEDRNRADATRYSFQTLLHLLDKLIARQTGH
ncbi:MAG: sugar phosphate isomerase/epimerase [Deltaproteobacteria bacterium]|nr:sugar phosphate isomerase/epimerase [Deltaproteobacteria bacterium]